MVDLELADIQYILKRVLDIIIYSEYRRSNAPLGAERSRGGLRRSAPERGALRPEEQRSGVERSVSCERAICAQVCRSAGARYELPAEGDLCLGRFSSCGDFFF